MTIEYFRFLISCSRSKQAELFVTVSGKSKIENLKLKIPIYRIIILLFILLAFGLRIPILKVRYFDPDEFQHLHSARQIYHGDVPYRDYFEHHTPFLHFVLVSLYPVFGERIRILFAARALMVVFSAAILCCTFILTAMLYGVDAGLFAALFLSYIIMFLEKSIEVRPDLPAVMFWLAALIFMVRGLQRNSDAPTLRWHLFSGLCMGMAIMSTQKALFAFGGISLSLAWTLADRRVGGSIKSRLKLTAAFLGGLMILIALVCLYFLTHRGLYQFINCNFRTPDLLDFDLTPNRKPGANRCLEKSFRIRLGFHIIFEHNGYYENLPYCES